MFAGTPSVRAWPRHVAVTLAIVALALKVLIPPGLMLDDSGRAGAIPLVFCSGHGVLILDGPDQKPAPNKSKPDHPCAFAGNLTPPTPDEALPPRAILWTQPAEQVRFSSDQAPGRGMAAPPPPSIGPPRFI